MATNPLIPPSSTATTPAFGSGLRILPPNRIPALDNAALAALEAEKALKTEAERAQSQPLVSSLAAFVLEKFRAALDYKRQHIEPRLREAELARKGQYDPATKAEIERTGGSRVYVMLTSAKCRAAASWIRDVATGQGVEKPWGIAPTPMPDLSPDAEQQAAALGVQGLDEAQRQAAMLGVPLTPADVDRYVAMARETIMEERIREAERRARLMERLMEDQLVEGGFYHALEQFIDDLVTFPAAILKGPILSRGMTLQWTQDADGQWVARNAEEIKLSWKRISPYRIYPSPTATSVSSGYLIELHELTQQELASFIGVEGYDEKSIRLVLKEYPDGLRMTTFFATIKESTIPQHQNVEGVIEALQFWGAVSGRQLREWGMSPVEVPDPEAFYQAEIWVIGRYVIKALLNRDPLGRKPYYVESYERVPGSFWGNGIYDLIKPCQIMCNAAARALMNNMAYASGPQVFVNIDRLAEGEPIEKFFPWRVWQTRSDGYDTSSGPPVGFFMPDSNANELMAVFTQWFALADEVSGIPRYLQGENPGTPGRTAAGMNLLMGNASRGVRQVILNISQSVWKPVLEMLYDHNMKYASDPDVKGDMKVQAAGMVAMLARESEHARRLEFLQMTANPVDMQIVGLQGRAEILREVAKHLGMDTSKIVPDRDTLERMMAAQSQAQQMQAAMAQTPAPEEAPGGLP